MAKEGAVGLRIRVKSKPRFRVFFVRLLSEGGLVQSFKAQYGYHRFEVIRP